MRREIAECIIEVSLFFSLALHSSRPSLFLVRDISFHGGLELLAPVGLMVRQKPYVWDEVVKRCTDVVLGNEIFSLLRSILISFLILQAGPLLYYLLLFSLFYFLSYSFSLPYLHIWYSVSAKMPVLNLSELNIVLGVLG